MTVDDDRLELEPLATAPARTTGQHAKVAAAPPRAGRVATLVLLLALVGLAGWELLAMLRQHAAAPREEDWRQAALTLQGNRKAGEPVLFAPFWVQPLGLRHLGAQLSDALPPPGQQPRPLELLLLSDVDRYARVWQVSLRGKQHPWLAGLKPTRSWQLGAVTVALFEKPAEEVTHDFTRTIAGAKVEKVGDRVVKCPWDGKQQLPSPRSLAPSSNPFPTGQFLCDPLARWNKVGPHLAEVGHHPYRCIYAHPVEGHLMRITFPAARLGKRIVGYTGIDDFENRKRSQKPVQLSVRVDGREVGTVLHQNAWPWQRFSFETPEVDGKTAEVRFEVSADAAFARTFCFAAEARR